MGLSKEKPAFRKIKHAVGLVLILVGFVALLMIRFTNPDMTETRLFIEYWYDWIAIIAVMLGGASLTNR